eukprot:s692_g2.t1
MADGRFDDLLMNMARKHKNVEELTWSMLSFFERRTDLFHVMETPTDRMGFVPGAAEKMLFKHFHLCGYIPDVVFDSLPETHDVNSTCLAGTVPAMERKGLAPEAPTLKGLPPLLLHSRLPSSFRVCHRVSLAFCDAIPCLLTGTNIVALEPDCVARGCGKLGVLLAKAPTKSKDLRATMTSTNAGEEGFRDKYSVTSQLWLVYADECSSAELQQILLALSLQGAILHNITPRWQISPQPLRQGFYGILVPGNSTKPSLQEPSGEITMKVPGKVRVVDLYNEVKLSILVRGHENVVDFRGIFYMDAMECKHIADILPAVCGFVRVISDPYFRDSARALPSDQCYVVFNGRFYVGEVAEPWLHSRSLVLEGSGVRLYSQLLRLDTEFAPHGQGTAETDGPRQPHPEKLWLSTGMIIHDNCLLMSCDGAVSSESRRHCATCVLRRASECLSVVPFRSASFLMCGAATRKWPVAISTATMCVSASGKRSSRCSNAPRRSMPWPPRPRIRYVRFRPLREADVGRVPVKRIEQDLLANFPKPKTNFTSPDPAQRGEERGISEACALHALKGIGEALVYIHSLKVVHSNVNPESIFIKRDGNSVLADFAYAVHMGEDTQVRPGPLALGSPPPPLFSAPEQVDDLPRYGLPADIFALGGCLYFSLSNLQPYRGKPTFVRSQDVSRPEFKDVSAKTQDFLRMLMYRDPSARPTAEEACQVLRNPEHSFFSDAVSELMDVHQPPITGLAGGLAGLSKAGRKRRTVVPFDDLAGLVPDAKPPMIAK